MLISLASAQSVGAAVQAQEKKPLRVRPCFAFTRDNPDPEDECVPVMLVSCSNSLFLFFFVGVACTQVIPMTEVQQHSSQASKWIVIHGMVYDVTPFLDDHPGGPDSLIKSGGLHHFKFIVGKID